MPLALQNALFAYYSQNLRFVLAWAKKNNKHDKGIEVIGGTYESLSLAEGKQVVSVYRDPRTGLDTRYWELVSDRGISFVEAKRILDDTEDPSGRDGFYVSSNNEQYQLAIHVGNNMFKLYKPNVGEIYTLCPLSDLKRGYTQVSPEDIQKRWTKRYDFSLNKCTHKLGGAATCKYERTQGYCEFGVRLRKHHLLGGNVMKIWDTVESAMAFHSRTRLKIARTAGTTAETLKAIGLAVPGSAIGDVLGALKRLGKIDEMDKKDQEAETREHSKVATGSKVAVKVKSEVKVEVESEVESEVKLEVKAETESETELMEVDGGDEGEDSDCFLLD